VFGADIPGLRATGECGQSGFDSRRLHSDLSQCDEPLKTVSARGRYTTAVVPGGLDNGALAIVVQRKHAGTADSPEAVVRLHPIDLRFTARSRNHNVEVNMVTACKRPGGSCAPRGLADGLGELLHDNGYLLPGARVRVLTDRLRLVRVVVGPLLQWLGGGVVVSYRLQSLSFDGRVTEIVVAPELIVPDDDEPAAAVPAKPPAPPFGSDLLAEASRAVRDFYAKALSDDEPTAATPAQPAAQPEPPAQPGDGKSPAPGPLAWVQASATTRVSTDGRFTVVCESGPKFRVTDRWTGESSTGHYTEFAAHQWCKARSDAPALEWQEFPSALVARTASGLGFSVVTSGTMHVASDPRVGRGDPLRSSGVLADLAAAKRWCEVRACCDMEPPFKGGSPTLRYESPADAEIPF
jgi:hypothetical protein